MDRNFRDGGASFDVGEPSRVGDDRRFDSWEGLTFGQIEIPYELSGRHRDEERYIEGVLVRVTVDDAPPVSGSLLTDFVALAEIRWVGAGIDELVERTCSFMRDHGPPCLCEHGRGSGHDPECNSHLSWRQTVEPVLEMAEIYRAAVLAADGLRDNVPVSDTLQATLGLEEPRRLLFLLRATVHTEDWPALEARLADPVVSGWLRLESLVRRLQREAAGSLGCLPALSRQLLGACRRDGYRRVCRNPECDNDFIPPSSRHFHCSEIKCKRSRSVQRQRRMLKCPKCCRSLGKKNKECYFCGEPVSR